MGETCRANGGEEKRIKVLVGKPGNLGDPGVDWRIILRLIFRKWDVGVWIGASWPRIGRGSGHL